MGDRRQRAGEASPALQPGEIVDEFWNGVAVASGWPTRRPARPCASPLEAGLALLVSARAWSREYRALVEDLLLRNGLRHGLVRLGLASPDQAPPVAPVPVTAHLFNLLVHSAAALVGGQHDLRPYRVVVMAFEGVVLGQPGDLVDPLVLVACDAAWLGMWLQFETALACARVIGGGNPTRARRWLARVLLEVAALGQEVSLSTATLDTVAPLPGGGDVAPHERDLALAAAAALLALDVRHGPKPDLLTRAADRVRAIQALDHRTRSLLVRMATSAPPEGHEVLSTLRAILDEVDALERRRRREEAAGERSAENPTAVALAAGPTLPPGRSEFGLEARTVLRSGAPLFRVTPAEADVLCVLLAASAPIRPDADRNAEAALRQELQNLRPGGRWGSVGVPTSNRQVSKVYNELRKKFAGACGMDILRTNARRAGYGFLSMD